MLWMTMVNASFVMKELTSTLELVQVNAFPTIILILPLGCGIIPNCLKCSDASTCTSCADPYILDDNDQCQPCNEGTFFNSGTCSSKYISNYCFNFFRL